jgi:hypothetical protein
MLMIFTLRKPNLLRMEFKRWNPANMEAFHLSLFLTMKVAGSQ